MNKLTFLLLDSLKNNLLPLATNYSKIVRKDLDDGESQHRPFLKLLLTHDAGSISNFMVPVLETFVYSGSVYMRDTSVLERCCVLERCLY